MKELPKGVCIHIASFTWHLPQNSCMVFYDDYYDDEERRDEVFHACQQMMTFPSVRLPNNQFAATVKTDALDVVCDEDESFAWDEHFQLDMCKTAEGTIVIGNNSGDYVPIGTLRKRTFTKLVWISKSFAMPTTFISDCDLFDNTWIENPHESCSVHVGLRIDQATNPILCTQTLIQGAAAGSVSSSESWCSTCLICLEPLPPHGDGAPTVLVSNIPVRLVCNCTVHAHPTCLAHWLQRTFACPICHRAAQFQPLPGQVVRSSTQQFANDHL